MAHQEHCGDARFWLGLSIVPNIGAAKIAKLIEYFGSAKSAWLASPAALQAAGLDRRALNNLLETRRRLDLSGLAAGLARQGISLLTPVVADYPELLHEIAVPPPLLYASGLLAPEDVRAVAIVGSRRMSQYGKQITRQLVAELVHNGVTIVSGLARGVDSVAHRVALQEGGRTIAVLGSGLDRIYPPENRQLAREIVANRQGVILTEYPLGTKPDARHFPPRNRIISGLVRGVVVVEAGEKSGSLITTTFALEQGREVFAVPGPVNSPLSQGTNALLRDGATLVRTAADILEELRWQPSRELPGRQLMMPGTSEEISLWRHLSLEPVHVDDLCRLTLLSPAVVNSTLTLMELKGMVTTAAPLTYIKSV